MSILVLNCGSSSVKFKVFRGDRIILEGMADAIGLPNSSLKIGAQTISPVLTHEDAIQKIIDRVHTQGKLKAIGHRVVHGGEFYEDATIITPNVIRRISELCDLAPLHNPANLAGIQACMKMLPHIPQVAVFDTAFHQTIPEHAYLYAIPYDYYKRQHIRKYGFHGINHQYIALKVREILKKPCNIVSCHLGNGASITSIRNGKSVDTSMGFTPLEGLMMGTRSGDVDPGIIGYLSVQLRKTSAEIVNILNKESGLKGISGYSDMRIVHAKAVKGDRKCLRALDLYSYILAKHIGAYFSILPSVHALVFTAGIGEKAFYVRERACRELGVLGIKIDAAKNRKNAMEITGKGSKVRVFVIPANEEWMIARETEKILKSESNFFLSYPIRKST